MRRKDREVTSKDWIYQVLHDGTYMTLALATPDGCPYALPISYGLGDGYLIIHGAKEGKKIDMFKANPRVAFNVTLDAEVKRSLIASKFTMHYRSVSGTGTVRILDDVEEKRSALQVLMKHFDGPTGPFPDIMLKSMFVGRIDIEQLTGKTNGHMPEN